VLCCICFLGFVCPLCVYGVYVFQVSCVRCVFMFYMFPRFRVCVVYLCGVYVLVVALVASRVTCLCQAAVLGDKQALEDVHGKPRCAGSGLAQGLRGLKGVKGVNGVRGVRGLRLRLRSRLRLGIGPRARGRFCVRVRVRVFVVDSPLSVPDLAIVLGITSIALSGSLFCV
jgi:hypothetical protein